MIAKPIVLTFAALCALAVTAEASFFTLYENTHFGGFHRNFDFNDNGCHTLPTFINDRSSSINTYGGCVKLYEHGLCKGRRVTFHPNERVCYNECCTHRDFGECGFNDKASSFRIC